MSAKPRRSADAHTDPVTAPVSDDADQLRALVSAMLSGTYKEEFYLWDVASLCRAKPEFARQLLALIDRYHRLGQMSAAQHEKIKDKIEQTVALRAAPLSRSSTSDAPTRANTTSPLSAGDAAAEQRASAVPAAPSAPAAGPATAAAASNAGAAADADTDTDAVDAPTAAAMAALAATRPVSSFGRATRPAGNAPAQMTAAEVMAAAQAMEAALAAPPSPAQRAAVIGPGTVLRERYELQALIGSGGMGAVYRALDRYRVSLGLPDSCVALKIVTAHPLGAASVLALGREFHNAQQLSHPSVVNVYEIDHEGDASFYTMELLDGERLSQLLDRIGGPLPARYALAIIRDIGAAIAHAHSRGVVHGDLKPHNIFITYGGQVRVLDFGGLSHSPAEPWISDDTSIRRSSYRTATPAYASCEQLDGHRAEPRDDIYAIACIAYELLTGNHPFDCTSSAQARARRLRPARPPRLRAERWRALRQGLAWERAQRPDRIEPWLDQLGVAEAAAHLPPTHQLTAGAPRGSAIGRAVLAALLLLALGSAVFGIELHGGVDWRQVMTTAQSRWQNTWQQWLSAAAGGSPAITAPANASPATAAPAAGAAVPGAADQATPGSAAASAAADSGIPQPRSSPTGGTQPGTVRARPRVASTAARLAALREAGAATEARARGSVAAAEPVAAGATADAGIPADAGGPAGAGTVPPGPAIGVRFAAPSYDVTDTAPAARVVVHRTGSADNDIHFVWWTVDDSAKADVDYAPLGVRTEVIPSGADNITIYIPIISNPLSHETTRFYVALGAPGTGQSAIPAERASVTIERGG